MKSIYGKLFLSFLLTILLSFVITGYVAVRQNEESATQISESELKNSTEHIADLINLIEEKDLDKVLTDYADTAEISFRIMTYHNDKQYGQLSRNMRMSQKDKAELYSHIGSVLTDNKDSLSQYAKSFTIHKQSYIIVAHKDISQTRQLFLETYILSGLVLLVGGSVVFLLISDIFVKPIINLTKATTELSKGNYKVRVDYNGQDEIARLSNAFNSMAIQMEKHEETRQQFISDVSHEFQTPLTAITGFATILKNEELPKEQKEKYADIILYHSRRLSALSKNMLQLTILEREDTQLDIEEFSLIDQINRVIETQDYLALSKNIEIEFLRPKGQIMIEADESRLEQVWLNLINNAIKYTEDNGVVTVEIKKTSKDIQVSIQDTGVGMSQETMAHIFERFYRNDKSRSIEGNGLGLAIVKRILDLHEYKIDIQSQEDVGSTFTVYIPSSRLEGLVKRINRNREER